MHEPVPCSLFHLIHGASTITRWWLCPPLLSSGYLCVYMNVGREGMQIEEGAGWGFMMPVCQQVGMHLFRGIFIQISALKLWFSAVSGNMFSISLIPNSINTWTSGWCFSSWQQQQQGDGWRGGRRKEERSCCLLVGGVQGAAYMNIEFTGGPLAYLHSYSRGQGFK